MAYSLLQGKARGGIAQILHMLCMQIWRRAGLEGLKRAALVVFRQGFLCECASSYILIAWPCLKEQFDDAAISNCYSSITTLAVLGNETAWE